MYAWRIGPLIFSSRMRLVWINSPMLVPPKSATKQRGSQGPPPCEKIVTPRGLFLVLRMRAAWEFIQVRIAFVAQFLDQPDLRRVVTVDRVALDRVEKLDANLIFK